MNSVEYNDSDTLLSRGRQDSGALVHREETTGKSVFYRTLGAHVGDLLGFLMYVFVFGFLGLAIWLAIEISNDK